MELTVPLVMLTDPNDVVGTGLPNLFWLISQELWPPNCTTSAESRSAARTVAESSPMRISTPFSVSDCTSMVCAYAEEIDTSTASAVWSVRRIGRILPEGCQAGVE